MPISDRLAEAKETGRARARSLADDTAFHTAWHNATTWVSDTYPTTRDMDPAESLISFSRERMADRPDPARYPEAGSAVEEELARREGFRAVCPDPLREAFAFDWYFFVTRRVQTRFVACRLPRAHCTDFWFRDSREGGPIHGDNRDDVFFPYRGRTFSLPQKGPAEMRVSSVSRIGQVSASLLCDEEPTCLFPLDIERIIPAGLGDVREYVGYLERYADFWGPGNHLYVGTDWTVAAVEKANVRMGVRYDDGVGAITACAYLTPEMAAFKESCDRTYFAAAGLDPENCKERLYWDAAAARYRRLMALMKQALDKGPTMADAIRICLDRGPDGHALPESICRDGSRHHPDEPHGDVTLETNVTCHGGPARRGYHWRVDTSRDEPAPIWTARPAILPGPGVTSDPAWEREAMLSAG